MNTDQIREIILRVLSEQESLCREVPLDVPVEVSARHVHLTREAVERLFGSGASLTPKRPLSQPGQYLCEQRVSIVTEKGRLDNVAVLGPVRSAVQTELSATDCRSLGIKAPLRMSGDLEGAADVYLVGPKGMVEAKGSAIVAKAHIHLPPADAEKAGLRDGQTVAVTLPGERSVTLNNIVCRVSPTAGLAMHIDFDEANACMLPAGAMAGIKADLSGAAAAGVTQPVREPARQEEVFDGKLITEAVARQIAGRTKTLTVKKHVILTPSAMDVFRHGGVELNWQEESCHDHL